MIELATAGYGLLAAAHLGLAVHLVSRGFLRSPAGPTEKLLASAAIASAVWGGAGALAIESGARTWALASMSADLLRGGLWLLMLLSILYSGDGSKFWRRPTAVVALVVWLLAAMVVVAQAFNVYGASRASGLTLMALAVTGLVVVEQVFRNQPAEFTWNIKPACIGLGIGYAFDIYLFSDAVMFGHIDQDALVARGAVHALTAPMLFVAAQRYGVWLQRVQLSRNAAFYSATLVLVGLYLLLIAGVGYYIRFFGGEWGRALQFAMLMAALLALTVFVLSTSMRASLRVFLGKHFFRYRFDYRAEWLRFTTMLSTPTQPNEVGRLVIRGLADLVECPAGSIWTQELVGEDFVETGTWNMASGRQKESSQSSLCRLLREREWIIDVNEFRAHPRRYFDLVLPPWLSNHPNIWLVIPLMVGGNMIGFVVLAQPRTKVDLNWEVRDLLKTAGRQAAVFLAQMHATEALLEARKFDAFNRMSAFVVHDLKNIITQLSLMMKNAHKHAANPEFQQDMLLTVESSLDKMRQMMTQLRSGQKPVGSASGVDLSTVLERLRHIAKARGREVQLDIRDAIATRGHEQRLERVLGHVVQNALDATTTADRVWIRLDRDAGRARITVGDSGAGMTKEFIRDQLFRPFNTTKEGGMGIGTYESYQYIKELGGSISVESEPGEGTEITFLLPLLDIRTQSDLTMPGVLSE